MFSFFSGCFMQLVSTIKVNLKKILSPFLMACLFCSLQHLVVLKHESVVRYSNAMLSIWLATLLYS